MKNIKKKGKSIKENDISCLDILKNVGKKIEKKREGKKKCYNQIRDKLYNFSLTS